MLISDENNVSVEIKSIDEPTSIDYFWTLDLQEQDFKLSKLVMLEEFLTPTLTIAISGVRITLPAEWHILVYSPETSEVDLVQISDLTKNQYTLFAYNHEKSKVVGKKARVMDYSSATTFRTPSFNKNIMVCYPLGKDSWIMVAPTDTYNKYLKNSITVGNFLY